MIHWRDLKRNGSIAGRPTSKLSTKKPKKRKMLVICSATKWMIGNVQQTCKAWWSNKTKCNSVITHKIEWREWEVCKGCICTSISNSSDLREAFRQASTTNLVSHINNPILCLRSTRLIKDLSHKGRCHSARSNSHLRGTILVIIPEVTRAARQEILNACTAVKCFQVIIKATISQVWALSWVHHLIIHTQCPEVWPICSSRRA